ncbi:MAG: hypothetical protein BGO98_25865 [Myxococcales bacterium 68-20]|nr:hypothetical protein [Myxococcales bacterium]OJY16074.1 MAG: hypothetical protein BGO98_25865 [Myxococcales bacterium 68-20]
MKMRLFLLAGIVTGIAASIVACAEDGGVSSTPEPEPERVVPESEGSADAGMDAEAGVCDDCELFPDVCSEDALCPNGPFEPATVGGAFDARARVYAITGRSASDVWVAGALGMLAHFDGTSWSRSASGTRETMRALWIRANDEVAFGRPEVPYTRGIEVADAAGTSDGGWSVQAPVTMVAAYRNSGKYLKSAWAPEGAEWLWLATESVGENDATSGLWRLRRAPSGIFEIADGIPWSACGYFGCRKLTKIHGSSADDLWAVGPAGMAVHVTGAQGDAPVATPHNSRTTNALRGVWAASPTDVWAVGGMGTIRHYTGDPGGWDVVADVPTSATLNAVWGISATDIWAVGERATVLHYDGKSWSRVKVAGLEARRPDLDVVWSPGPGHLWIGGQGVVLSLGGKP